MGFNGSGGYTRVHNWVTDKNAGIKIIASRFDAEMDDMASAFTMCLTKDGQQDPTANLPMANFKHTGVAAASARTEYMDVASYMDGAFVWAGVASGTSAITLSLNPTITAYTTGMRIGFIAAGDNASAVTVNIDGVSAAAGVKGKADALVASDIVSGGAYWITYKGADGFQFGNPLEENPTFITLTTTGNATIGGTASVSATANFADGNFSGDVSISGALAANGFNYPSTDGTANQAIITDGAGGFSVGQVLMPPGYINGLQMSNGTDATNDIDIATGICTPDNAISTNIQLTSTVVKQFDVAWASGTNAGGRASAATSANDTWYHVFVIADVTNGVIDAGFDTSLTATNLLSDASTYTAYRRVGSILRGTGTNTAFLQEPDGEFIWEAPVIEKDGTGTTETLTITTPPDVICKAFLNLNVKVTSTQDAANLAHTPDIPDISAAVDGLSMVQWESGAIAGSKTPQVYTEVHTNTSSQIDINNSSGDTLRVILWGYRDQRGKN